MTNSKAKRLFTNLVIAAAKLEEKKQLKEQVKKQIGKVRKVSLESYPPKKQEMDKAITKLESTIFELLEREKMIMGVQARDEAMMRNVEQKTATINEKLEKMNSMLALMTGTEAKPAANEQIMKLQKTLEMLENKHTELKSQGIHSPEDLARVEEKINLIKSKLSFLGY